MKEIDDFINDHIMRVHEAIEQACELALQSGEHGVLVVHNRDRSVDVSVSPTVPYGYIHEQYD